ncbi:UV DNA damage repair endonuclease UvsE [Tissierella creatinini]|nr:UV DNA damage repair endonuclease UvsE [Tissierella creatinini]TJX66374.1 UV DNA damage repair endonuclease UvsE [Soehngenia saccharolytica]
MKIGYACKLIGVPNTNTKSCTLKSATSERLSELIEHNIGALNNAIDYNIDNNIKLFRISSDIIPFGSSEINQVKWWEIFSQELDSIGKKIKESNMRVSVHPGQYTVLNSNNEDVVKKAVDDLIYHTRILDSLKVNCNHKMVLHIGGAYDDKKKAIQRFMDNYSLLEDNVKKRLVIENDDKIYNIEEVLDIGIKLDMPVIFDNLHHEINRPDNPMDEKYWIDQCKNTWKREDGPQKVHYSQQAKDKKTGSHSDFIGIEKFLDFLEGLERNDIDIMLEVKDKNLSCIKCINCTDPNLRINALEKEWSKYKYTILEHSHIAYLKMRNLLKDKEEFNPVLFYTILENGLEKDRDTGSFENAALHVWGYFKNKASEKERNDFFKQIERFKKQEIGINIVKNNLRKLTEKYKESYLLNSYYFDL